MDLSALSEWGPLVAVIGNFGAIVWWAARQDAIVKALVEENKKLVDEIGEMAKAIKDHIEHDHTTHLELYRAIERIAAIQEERASPTRRPRPRVVDGGAN